MATRFLSFSLLCHLGTAFTHPGLLVTDTDISRIQAKIAAQADPWTSSWNKLTSLSYSSTSYTANALASISRGSTGWQLWHDAAAAFNLALRWKVTGETEYADTSAAVLAAWASTLEELTGSGDDDYLTAGLQGYELANAAELLRGYEPFAANGLADFTAMLERVFLPMNRRFINHELPSEHNVLHFFANWELCNLASIMAIGVLSDNQTTWDFAIDYLKNGNGNGALNNAISFILADPDSEKPIGQGQESGRDQGHSALDQQLLAAIGQQAWNQGEDLFAFNDSRILLGAEYFARYNLGHDVPFQEYTNGIVDYTEISNKSRGTSRPTWELLYAHYVQIKGLDAPWVTEYLNSTVLASGGFELGAGAMGEGSGRFDGLGWGSLLYRLDDEDVSSSAPATVVSTSVAASGSSSTASISTTTSASSVSSVSSSNLTSSSTVSSSDNLAVSSTVLSIATSTSSVSSTGTPSTSIDSSIPYSSNTTSVVTSGSVSASVALTSDASPTVVAAAITTYATPLVVGCPARPAHAL